MDVNIKVFLHPGFITSKTDGDRHFISGRLLSQLYGVDLDKCVIADLETDYRDAHGPVGIHLYPDYSGEYEQTRAMLAAIGVGNG